MAVRKYRPFGLIMSDWKDVELDACRHFRIMLDIAFYQTGFIVRRSGALLAKAEKESGVCYTEEVGLCENMDGQKGICKGSRI